MTMTMTRHSFGLVLAVFAVIAMMMALSTQQSLAMDSMSDIPVVLQGGE